MLEGPILAIRGGHHGTRQRRSVGRARPGQRRPRPCSSPTGCGAPATSRALRAGDRLPSSRALAVELGVSHGHRRGLRPAARRGLGRRTARLRDLRDDRAGRGRRRGGGGGRGRSRGRRADQWTCARARPASRWSTARCGAGLGGRPRTGAANGAVPVSLPAFRAAVVEHLLRHRGLPRPTCSPPPARPRSPSWPPRCRPGARIGIEEPATSGRCRPCWRAGRGWCPYRSTTAG